MVGKSVLISIQPKWCELIASGKKTIEVRKTKPKIPTPFKVYIYCTKPKSKNDLGICIENGKIGLVYQCNYDAAERYDMQILSGKVIGEYICDGIISHCEMANADIAEQQGLIKREKLLEYANGKELYGWHISNLKIYDKPKELSEFFVVDNEAVNQCEYRNKCYINPDLTNGGWLNGTYSCSHNGEHEFCTKCKVKPLTRPPKSWCYVEEI